MNRLKGTLEQQFWAKVGKSESGCWEWQGHRMLSGYGAFYRDGRHLAHRVSYQLMRGPIPQGMSVCHTCDNPPCVNPDHLWLGTAKDNSQDALRKGRLRQPEVYTLSDDARRRISEASRRRYLADPTLHRGERNPAAKLTADQVRAIREAYSTGLWRQHALGAKYGVSRETIGSIVRGDAWAA